MPRPYTDKYDHDAHDNHPRRTSTAQRSPRHLLVIQSASGSPDKSIYQPESFPNRASLIRFLVGKCGWSRRKVSEQFGLSDRHVRRLTTSEQMRRETTERSGPGDGLTMAEVETMARDYASDPYMSTEDREAAFDYLQQGCPPIQS